MWTEGSVVWFLASVAVSNSTSSLPSSPRLHAPLTLLDSVTFAWEPITAHTIPYITAHFSVPEIPLGLLDPWRWGHICFPETSVTNYQLTVRKIPEELGPQNTGFISVTEDCIFGHRWAVSQRLSRRNDFWLAEHSEFTCQLQHLGYRREHNLTVRFLHTPHIVFVTKSFPMVFQTAEGPTTSNFRRNIENNLRASPRSDTVRC